MNLGEVIDYNVNFIEGKIEGEKRNEEKNEKSEDGNGNDEDFGK